MKKHVKEILKIWECINMDNPSESMIKKYPNILSDDMLFSDNMSDFKAYKEYFTDDELKDFFIYCKENNRDILHYIESTNDRNVYGHDYRGGLFFVQKFEAETLKYKPKLPKGTAAWCMNSDWYDYYNYVYRVIVTNTSLDRKTLCEVLVTGYYPQKDIHKLFDHVIADNNLFDKLALSTYEDKKEMMEFRE